MVRSVLVLLLWLCIPPFAARVLLQPEMRLLSAPLGKERADNRLLGGVPGAAVPYLLYPLTCCLLE